jgi:hypothetical protein
LDTSGTAGKKSIDSLLTVTIAQKKSLESARTKSSQGFLELDNPVLTFEQDKVFVISYDVENLSSIPLQANAQRESYLIQNRDPTPIEVENVLREFKPLSILTVNGRVIVTKLPSPKPLSQFQYDGLMSGNYYIYLCGEIRYKNLVTSENKRYLFCYKLKPIFGNTVFKNNTYYKPILKQNSEIPKSSRHKKR